MADAEMLYDCIVEQIEVEGGFVQGGMVQEMPAEDVVAGSPLAKALGWSPVSNRGRTPDDRGVSGSAVGRKSAPSASYRGSVRG